MSNELTRGEIVEIALDDIIPNRFQPRLAFDEQSLNELAKSIRQHGIIQPLVLRKVGNKYEIIAGERRYKASYIAGLNKVPAIIIDLNDNESAEVAIVENLQREDLSPIEEAKSYKKLLDRGYLTQDQLAARMGKTQATISNKLRLLNLDEQVQDALLNNKISERHARSLLRLQNKADQIELLNEIIERRLNVRITEDAINARLNGMTFSEFFSRNMNENKVVPPVEIINPEETNGDFVDFSHNIPSLSKPKEPEIVQKDQFINPTFNVEKEDPIKENPIPFIRPVLDDNYQIGKTDKTEDLIKPMPKQIDDNSFPVPGATNRNMQMAEEKINQAINAIKDLGFSAKLEEYDFENIYQFVIKVDKK